jgi:hypothetical protein
MNTSQNDELIRYLTSEGNLRCTLDILSRGDEIRRHVYREFWRETQNKLRGSVPKSLRSRKLEWALWPGENKMHTESAGVYIYPAEFSRQSQGINFSVAIDINQSLFVGLSWEDAPKSSLLQLPSIAKLRGFMVKNDFKPTKWWLGWKYVIHIRERDELLVNYAKDREKIYRQIEESFWPFVEETFDMVVKANKAVRNSR